MHISEERLPSSLGQILQRARLARGITLEDAERVTRIPRRYLQALEEEEYGILPAPVYARGFLRSYASYLGLDSSQLLPLFPVGHVEEPRLQPLPKVRQPRPWSMSAFVALGAVVAIVVAVVALYGLRGDNESPLLGSPPSAGAPSGSGLACQVSAASAIVGDLFRCQQDEVVAALRQAGIDYLVVAIRTNDVAKGLVVRQNPPPNTALEPGQVVTLIVSR